MHVRTALTTRIAQPSEPTPSAPTQLPDGNPIPGAPVWPSVTGPTWALWDETTVIPAIVTAIDNAQQIVNAEYFQITDTGKGQLVTDALARAAKRGVEVNVIADFMSVVTPPPLSFHRFKKIVTEAGGTVITTSRIPFSRRVKENPALAHVDHRKVLTIDGDVAFTGGMNLAKMTDFYHDSMLQLSGVDAARLGVNQLNRWSAVGGAVSAVHRKVVADALGDAPLEPTSPTAMHVVSNAPDEGQFGLSNAYLDAIRGAKHRLWISSPAYTSQPLIAELNAAAARGVDVRFVMPGTAPVGIPLINWVTASHLAELTKLGATAYAIPEVLHRKALVADDTAILGSFNITDRSAQHDHEIGIKSSDPTFVETIANVLTSDMTRGTKLEPGARTGVGKWIGDLLAQTFHLSY
ncbi:MAG: phosphatidylserine/phosphatidylglycerophosphate/cardiolipin synthase family protein [Thermoleophilia bacterium]|nr:phosphatidylserine/phosphatidylglycerophosphate/cardiolipin synthase family protein [Thermoleophilia bacterium]